jgi:1-deoxy-D-xylulose-5-phosphate synthase
LNHEVLITIEEGSIGGFGSHVFQMLSERGIFDKGLKIRSMILPDKFINQDTPDNMYAIAGLDAESIEKKVLETLNSNIVIPKKINLVN